MNMFGKVKPKWSATSHYTTLTTGGGLYPAEIKKGNFASGRIMSQVDPGNGQNDKCL